MFTFQIPTFSGSLTRPGALSGGVSVTQIRAVQKRLKAIEPGLRAELIREAKKPAKPIADAIKKRLATIEPLSGMHRGRLNWYASKNSKGQVFKPDTVRVAFRTKSSGYSKITTLVSVRAMSPAVAFADMAGRSGRYIGAGYKGSGYTREYAWKNTRRRHRVTSQGEKLIANLGGGASRYVWPSVDAEGRESAIRVIDKVVDYYIKKAGF